MKAPKPTNNKHRTPQPFERSRAAAGRIVPAIKDVTNKAWTLVVLFTLWIAAGVILTADNLAIHGRLQQGLAIALFALGLMFLFTNLRSSSTATPVVE